MMRQQAADAVEHIAGEKPVALKRLHVPGAIAAYQVDLPGHPARLVACALRKEAYSRWTQAITLVRERGRNIAVPESMCAGKTYPGQAGLIWVTMSRVAYTQYALLLKKKNPRKTFAINRTATIITENMRQSHPAGFGLAGGPFAERWIDWYMPRLDHEWRVFCQKKGLVYRLPLIRRVAAESRNHAPAMLRASAGKPAMCLGLSLKGSGLDYQANAAVFAGYMPDAGWFDVEYALAGLSLQGKKMRPVIELVSREFQAEDDRRAMRLAMYRFWETLRQATSSSVNPLVLVRLVLLAWKLHKEMGRFPSDLLS